MGPETMTPENRPEWWRCRLWKRLIVAALLLGLALDFVCYQLYGVGLIFGKVLTVDVDINLTFR